MIYLGSFFFEEVFYEKYEIEKEFTTWNKWLYESPYRI